MTYTRTAYRRRSIAPPLTRRWPMSKTSRWGAVIAAICAAEVAIAALIGGIGLAAFRHPGVAGVLAVIVLVGLAAAVVKRRQRTRPGVDGRLAERHSQP